MKLELTLPERPGLLHAVPLVNLVMLLWVLFLLAPSLTRQAGVVVELPPSKFQLDRYQESLVVTLGLGESEPQVYLGRNLVGVQGLSQELDRLKQEGKVGNTLILLQTDVGVPVGMERNVAELILSKGLRLAMVGATKTIAEEGAGESKQESIEGKQHE